MKSRIIRVFTTVLLLYLFTLALGEFSLPEEREVHPGYSPTPEQWAQQQIEESMQRLEWVESAIDAHYDTLLFLQKMMEIIGAINRQVNNQERYLMATAIYREAQKYNLDPLIILAVMCQESHFRKNAVGAHNELGLMQVKPATGEKMARQMNLTDYDLFDIDDNIALGTRYLIYCLNRTTSYAESSHENIQYGLAAYNRGLWAVLEDLEAGKNPKNAYQRDVLEIHTRIIQEYL